MTTPIFQVIGVYSTYKLLKYRFIQDEEVAMHYKAFDTHKYIKNLQETGFNERQAEVIVKSLLESRDFDISILATREQVSNVDTKIDRVESNLDAKIDRVESNLDAKIDKFESNLDAKIDKFESNLDAKIDKLDGKIEELKSSISSNKYDIIKWMVTLFITMIIAIYFKS
ncbi:CCDC90 family protein [Candidatus Bandiella euplotis]|nr:hypothetical protein [Candidatus Bandiella woodruffii]